MSPLEIKRLETEIIRVGAARAEMEYKIAERQDDIDRLKAEIENQDKRILEIKLKIKEGQK